jgi:uncharacterized membrane protein
MSDQTKQGASGEGAVTDTSASDEAEIPVQAEVIAGGGYTLLAAEFGDTDTALQAYEALKDVEDGATVEIEGVLVVRRTDAGVLEVQKVTDHSTRRGLGWGLLGGVVLGVLFPPSILGSAVVLGAGGAGIGRLRERHNKKELEEELREAIAPGHSGIIALVSDPGELKIRKALEKADKIVEKAIDQATADDLKSAAKNTDTEKESDTK